MFATRKSALAFGVLAALLWSPHFYALEPIRQSTAPALVVQFHLLLWPFLGLLLVVFIGGQASALSVFSRRETYFLILAATGGYGFWVLRGLALESPSPAHARLLFCAAPLLMGIFSLFTREKADRRIGVALLLGFLGCWLIIMGQHGGSGGAVSGAFRSSVLALSAAACWALFSLLARPVVREEKTLPVAALVVGIGVLCLFVTCLSTGDRIWDISPAQLRTVIVTGLVTVGLMMVVWLKCISGMPVALAAPLWYLAVLFGAMWARRAGVDAGGLWGWWPLVCGGVLIVIALHSALAGRRRGGVTISDMIRG